MHLHDLLGWSGPLTDRQYQRWKAWMQRQWNKPSREDYYLMQIFSGIVASKGGNMSGWPKIPFKFGVDADEAASGMTLEEAVAAARANAVARAGPPATIRRVRPDGTLIEEVNL